MPPFNIFNIYIYVLTKWCIIKESGRECARSSKIRDPKVVLMCSVQKKERGDVESDDRFPNQTHFLRMKAERRSLRSC
jgi:hypothetical protein